MISQRIQAILDFIDYLDKNKKLYINEYIPLCKELEVLLSQRDRLNPKNNYHEKQEYDKIQAQILEKFEPITQNIYNPISKKLIEFGIWSGDQDYSSIWNNNYSAIHDFKENFETKDIPSIMVAKHKYLNFRNETNTDFLSLKFAFQSLDDIIKELFDFFKDTNENEFAGFESKKIEVNSIGEALNKFRENPNENLSFKIPMPSFSNEPPNKDIVTTNIRNELIMGDKFQIGDIPNNRGQINIGKDNKTNVNDKDELTRKSFNWQKAGIILASLLAIATIILMIII